MSDQDLAQSLIAKIGGYKWVAYILLLVLLVNGAATFTDSLRKLGTFMSDARATMRKERLTDRELREQALVTAQELFRFVGEGHASEPPVDFGNFNQYTRQLILHNQAIQNEYLSRYSGTIELLRDEFRKRGSTDSDLDEFYARPMNLLGIQAVAAALGRLRERVPK